MNDQWGRKLPSSRMLKSNITQLLKLHEDKVFSGSQHPDDIGEIEENFSKKLEQIKSMIDHLKSEGRID